MWEGIDGTRSIQHYTAKKFPKGFNNRYFSCWYTWEARVLKDGRKEFIIAVAPMSEYIGSRRSLKKTEGMTECLTR